MDLLQATLLSFVQGITEFLPISSKGHLNLTQHYLGLSPSLAFDIFLNTATLLSVVGYFIKDIKFFFQNLKFIVIGTLPAIFAGFFLKTPIESTFSDVLYLPYFLLVSSILLLSSKNSSEKEDKLTLKSAIIIGFAQSLALFPGVSRSGSTIATGLLLGLKPVIAFKYSFSLFIPASLGALALGFHDISNLKDFGFNYVYSFILTAFVGYFSLIILKKILSRGKIWYFGIYTLLLSIFLFFTL